jgi:SAM-dependent methyltransferase
MASAVEKWGTMVAVEHAQTDRLRDPAPPTSDHWQGIADRFRVDLHRADDPLLAALASRLKSHHTLLDVGAGAGRLAVPLALRCNGVVAVEPSQAMVDALREDVDYYGIANLELVQAGWEEARVKPQDLVLCSHVLYTVREIGAFLQKLTYHARNEVWVVIYREPPQRRIYPLWKMVHEEERLWLPALPQLKDVLQEMGMEFQVEDLPSQALRAFESQEQAWSQLRGRMFLTEGSPKDRRLGRVLEEELVQTADGLALQGVSSPEPVLVIWKGVVD